MIKKILAVVLGLSFVALMAVVPSADARGRDVRPTRKTPATACACRGNSRARPHPSASRGESQGCGRRGIDSTKNTATRGPFPPGQDSSVRSSFHVSAVRGGPSGRRRRVKARS